MSEQKQGGSKNLFEAAKVGDIEFLNKYIEEGKDINVKSQSSDGEKALLTSMRLGKYEFAEKLIDAGADVNIQNFTLDTPLHYAAMEGNAKLCQKLAEKTKNKDVGNFNKTTPLHAAAASGNREAVEALISAGANPDKTNIYGKTALHLAAREGKENATKELIDSGADINKQDNAARTALHQAAVSGNKNITENLLKNNANLDIIDIWGNTPLHDALNVGNEELSSSLQSSKNVAFVNKEGETPLHIAALKNGSTATIGNLISREAPLNMQNHNDDTPSHNAAKSGNNEALEALKSAGAKQNLKNKQGLTPDKLSKVQEKFASSNVSLWGKIKQSLDSAITRGRQLVASIKNFASKSFNKAFAAEPSERAWKELDDRNPDDNSIIARGSSQDREIIASKSAGNSELGLNAKSTSKVKENNSRRRSEKRQRDNVISNELQQAKSIKLQKY